MKPKVDLNKKYHEWLSAQSVLLLAVMSATDIVDRFLTYLTLEELAGSNSTKARSHYDSIAPKYLEKLNAAEFIPGLRSLKQELIEKSSMIEEKKIPQLEQKIISTICEYMESGLDILEESKIDEVYHLNLIVRGELFKYYTTTTPDQHNIEIIVYNRDIIYHVASHIAASIDAAIVGIRECDNLIRAIIPLNKPVIMLD